MGFKVDHSAGSNFETVKPGEYEVKAINFTLDKANSGNNMVIVDYEIRSDVDQPCQGQKILYDNFVVTDKSMWRFQQASAAAGFPNGKEFDSYKEWANEFIEKPIRVVVEDRTYNGKTYPQIKGFKVSEASFIEGEPIDIKDEDTPF